MKSNRFLFRLVNTRSRLCWWESMRFKRLTCRSWRFTGSEGGLNVTRRPTAAVVVRAKKTDNKNRLKNAIRIVQCPMIHSDIDIWVSIDNNKSLVVKFFHSCEQKFFGFLFVESFSLSDSILLDQKSNKKKLIWLMHTKVSPFWMKTERDCLRLRRQKQFD